MNILIINQHPHDVIGGSEIQCDLLAAALSRFGHHVCYFAIDGKQQTYHTNYAVEPNPLTRKALRRVVERFRPNIVYWRFNKRRFLASALLLKWLKIKVVFAISHINDTIKWSHKVRYHAATFRETLHKWRLIARPALSSRINHFGYYWVDGVVAQLRSQAGKIPAAKEVVIANSGDSRVVPFSWSKPFIAWISSIKASKNPEIFLELARHFQHTGIDFLMIGKIGDSQYASYAEKGNLPANVHYLGAKSYHEVNGILQASLFLAHTCEPEGFPNVFIQAWMQGKPTVTLYYDPDQMIQEHQLGYCSGNMERFIHDVKIFIDNAALREDMGRRAKVFADAHFDLEKNARAVEAFFQEICHG